MKNTISKENYISAAYDILSREGIGAVTIRRLAKDLDCNSANLYRYFSGVEELAAYASLKYLKDYLHEVARLTASIEDPLELHFAVWECFARCTFSSPEVFHNLFWGSASPRLDAIMRSYYDLFPDELEELSPSLHALFLKGDFDHRDYLMLERCVEAGLFNEESARFLNTVSMHLYKGYFKELLDQGETRDPRRSKEQFLSTLRAVFRLQMQQN